MFPIGRCGVGGEPRPSVPLSQLVRKLSEVEGIMPSMPLHFATAAPPVHEASSLDEGVGGDLAASEDPADPAPGGQQQQRQRPKLSKLSSFECASLSSCLGGTVNPGLGFNPGGDPNQLIPSVAAAVSAGAPSALDHLTHSLPGVGPMAGMAAMAAGAAAAGLAEATSDIVPPVTTAAATVGSQHYLQLPSAGVSSLGECTA